MEEEAGADDEGGGAVAGRGLERKCRLRAQGATAGEAPDSSEASRMAQLQRAIKEGLLMQRWVMEASRDEGQHTVGDCCDGK